MTNQPSQEELLEQQKKNCIFCKIVSGEVESKKVYEDDAVLAILDIRPAAEGHVILLPKQHAQILQLLPPQEQLGLYQKAIRMAGQLKEAMIAEHVTIFTASGHAAGQQAPHAMLHLIPREKGDGLSALDVQDRSKDQADAVALEPVFRQATEQVLAQLGKQDALAPKTEVLPPEEPVPANAPATTAEEEADVEEFADPNEALEQVLAANDDLRNLIIAQPSFVEDYVQKSPKLAKLFEDVDIHALSRALRAREAESAKKASGMSDEELFTFIDGNEGLRTWLVENPEELAVNISQNKKLQDFFEGVDILQLAKRYREARDD